MYDSGPRFIGPANYVQLSTDSEFQSSLGNTVEFTVLFLPVFVVGGLVAAAVIESLPRFGGIFRTIVFLPVIVALSVTGVMSDWIFDARVGLVNHALDMVGLHALTRDWLADPGLALPVIVAVSLWRSRSGCSMLDLHCGAAEYPRGHLRGGLLRRREPATGVLLAIAVPNIMESAVIATVWGIVQAIKVFDLPYVMTKGGPGGATETLYLHLWNTAFQDFRDGLRVPPSAT